MKLKLLLVLTNFSFQLYNSLLLYSETILPAKTLQSHWLYVKVDKIPMRQIVSYTNTPQVIDCRDFFFELSYTKLTLRQCMREWIV